MVKLTLGSSGILSCTPIHTHVRQGNRLRFRSDREGAVRREHHSPASSVEETWSLKRTDQPRVVHLGDVAYLDLSGNSC